LKDSKVLQGPYSQWSDDTARLNDLKPLTQHGETFQGHLQMTDMSSVCQPVDVPKITLSLAIFTSGRAFHLVCTFAAGESEG
jgi:hypothetical protein